MPASSHTQPAGVPAAHAATCDTSLCMACHWSFQKDTACRDLGHDPDTTGTCQGRLVVRPSCTIECEGE